VATEILHLPVESVTTTALRRRSNPMPISLPNCYQKTDRLRFGILIGITSESWSTSVRNADRHPPESADKPHPSL